MLKPKTYRKRPMKVKALQWTGTNADACRAFTGGTGFCASVDLVVPGTLYVAANRTWVEMEVGEWILKDRLGFYPCKDEVFAETYAPLRRA